MGRFSRIPKYVRSERRSSSSSSLFYLPVLAVFFFFFVSWLLFVSLPAKKSHHNARRSDYETNADDNQNVSLRMTMEILSWHPRAFLYHNFVSEEECDYLIKTATPHLTMSTVVDIETGKSIGSKVRTSSGMFFARGGNEVIDRIEKRIANVTFIPQDHGEGIQVLHYAVGQKYEPHFDFFSDKYNTKNGGQRIATMLMYLSNVEKGGETVFPNYRVNKDDVPWWDEISDCAKKGLSVRPRKGDALLFWSLNPDATEDPSSLHGSCPVIKGDKWSATKWMRTDTYVN